MAKQRNHVQGLSDLLTEYCEKRVLDFAQYSPYHMRVMDGGFVVLDVWTTGRYYVVMTDYKEAFDGNVVERGGEKGSLPITKPELWKFMDNMFYGNDMAEHTTITGDTYKTANV